MSSPNNHLVCLGFGYTAKALATTLKQDVSINTQWEISGTSRNHDKINAMEANGISAIPVTDKGQLDEKALTTLDKATHLMISMPPFRTVKPGAPHCPALEFIDHPTIKLNNCKWIGYLSSNGVYGDHKGAWVDEDTLPIPTGTRGKARLTAEKEWILLSQARNLPLTIFRLPGIYGPGRCALDSLKKGKAKRIIKPGQVFNRMHVDDIASALLASIAKAHSLQLNHTPETSHLVFNLCDDEASPPQDVITYAARLIGAVPPPEISIEDANLSPMGQSFYRDNKRISNARMKAELGIKLKYPSYREGLTAIKQGYQ